MIYIPPDKIKKKLEEVFPPHDPEYKRPAEWVAWEEGKSDYKPFSLQLNECTEDGNSFKENCPWCNKTLLMCKRHGGSCMAVKCRPDRIRKRK